MNTLRYLIALLLIVAVPAALVFWLLVHPFTGFWRRLGTRRAYGVLCSVLAAVMVSMVLLRARFLADDLGTNRWLALLGIACLVVSGWLLFKLRQKLSVRVLIGMPEVSSGEKGSLISDGIYARMRHPRYTQMTLALLGYALIANFPAAYGAFVLWCFGIYAVTLLEERELEARFGDDYRSYMKQVPRFVPRLR